MNKSIKRVLPFLFSFLLFLRLSSPAYSQSSLNSCFTSATAAQQCASTGLISPQTAANAVRSSLSAPSPLSPFTSLPSKEAVAILGGTAALAYLSQSQMQTLQDKGKLAYVPPFVGGQGVGVPYRVYYHIRAGSTYYPGYSVVANGAISVDFNTGRLSSNGVYVVTLGVSYTGGNPANLWGGKYSTESLFIDSIVRVDGLPNSSADTSPSLASAASAVPNSSIYAAGAVAAAAAAVSSTVDSDILAAALAAIAAAGFVSADPLASPSDIAAAAAASADAAIAAAAVTAKEQQVKDKAVADGLAPPVDLPKKDFKVSTNFLTYAVTGFASKFPFDVFFGGTDVATPACPSFSLFYYKWEMCFLMPLFLSIRWIVTISLSVKIFLEL